LLNKELQNFIDFLPDPTFTVNAEGVVTSWNNAMEALTGVMSGDILGKGGYEYAIPFYNKRIPVLIDFALKGTTPNKKHYQLIAKYEGTLIINCRFEFKKKGTCFWAKAKALYGTSGEVVGAIELIRDVTDYYETKTKILNTIIETEEKERVRFARDLHDEMGPFLSGVLLYLDELSSDDIKPEEKQSLLTYLKSMINDSIEKTRTITNNLRPRILIDFGLSKAIESFCRHINISKKFYVKFRTNIGNKRYNNIIETALYRIVIELINNTIKHSGVCIASVLLIESKNNLNLFFIDNGKGFDVDQALNYSNGNGLKNIMNRVEIMNGKIRIKSGRDQGVKIKIVVNL
jgi:signal transduction histidine kinase